MLSKRDEAVVGCPQTLTSSLFMYAERGYFESDRLLFALQLALSTQLRKGVPCYQQTPSHRLSGNVPATGTGCRVSLGSQCPLRGGRRTLECRDGAAVGTAYLHAWRGDADDQCRAAKARGLAPRRGSPVDHRAALRCTAEWGRRSLRRKHAASSSAWARPGRCARAPGHAVHSSGRSGSTCVRSETRAANGTRHR